MRRSPAPDGIANRIVRQLGEQRSARRVGGFSSGANLAAAMRLLQESQKAPEPARVVFLVNDSGLKYLSTDLWP